MIFGASTLQILARNFGTFPLNNDSKRDYVLLDMLIMDLT